MKKIFILSLICLNFTAVCAKAQMVPNYEFLMQQNKEKSKKETYYDSKGFTYTKSGNTIYKNDGTAYYKSGNTITGSDGSRYETSGGTIYERTGNQKNCRVQGTYVTCY